MTLTCGGRGGQELQAGQVPADRGVVQQQGAPSRVSSVAAWPSWSSHSTSAGCPEAGGQVRPGETPSASWSCEAQAAVNGQRADRACRTAAWDRTADPPQSSHPSTWLQRGVRRVSWIERATRLQSASRAGTSQGFGSKPLILHMRAPSGCPAPSRSLCSPSGRHH